MAIEPKTPRKRAAKKASSKKSDAADLTEVPETKSATKKKSASIPVPMFQAAPVAEKTVRSSKKAAPEIAAEETGDEDSRAGRNRRRRRGGRGRRKGGADTADTQNENSNAVEADDSEESTTHRRRRRRRATGEGVVPGETVEEDGVLTVVKVREARERTPRVEARRGRRDRPERGERREYREPYRRRGTIITDSEFLARRENVDREMVVRQIEDRIQIAVIEDKIMVEHYVNRNSNVSYVGNVYLGRVQNVLP
ncbi:MAG: Rne/Rng family ribonuclease, partial [Candidatus Planktophila sp.]